MTRKFNVLVVDDEPPLRSVLRTSLSACGFAVEEAGSAEQALEIIPQRAFDVVLLDINMPGMGGLEACHRIRALTPHVGIVMVTVRDAESDIVRALDAGADDYITKPFPIRGAGGPFASGAPTDRFRRRARSAPGGQPGN